MITYHESDIVFEALDGGHCYLRAVWKSGLIVLERFPAGASTEDIVKFGQWASRLR